MREELGVRVASRRSWMSDEALGDEEEELGGYLTYSPFAR